MRQENHLDDKTSSKTPSKKSQNLEGKKKSLVKAQKKNLPICQVREMNTELKTKFRTAIIIITPIHGSLSDAGLNILQELFQGIVIRT